MLFESVFLDRTSATRLSDYVQAFEATRKKPQLIRLMWQVRSTHTRLTWVLGHAQGLMDRRAPAAMAEPHTV
jgi:hypothetical protein